MDIVIARSGGYYDGSDSGHFGQIPVEVCDPLRGLREIGERPATSASRDEEMRVNDTDVTEINIPFPEASDRRLRISVGACRLKVRPGSGAAWVTGTHRDPSGALPCRIVLEDGEARITQAQRASEVLGLLSGVPTFDLALGRGQPYELTLETGASEADLDLGGLPISRLFVKHGAGKTDIRFSAPNPVPMSLFEISSGAVAMEVQHLANANFAEMTVEGGAASY